MSTSFSATPKVSSTSSSQQKQSLLLCNNPAFSSPEKLTNRNLVDDTSSTSLLTSASSPASVVSQSDNPDSLIRKRTRGVQSSILTAMALKEKRATLSEAKDIRKVSDCITTSENSGYGLLNSKNHEVKVRYWLKLVAQTTTMTTSPKLAKFQ